MTATGVLLLLWVAAARSAEGAALQGPAEGLSAESKVVAERPPMGFNSYDSYDWTMGEASHLGRWSH
jgi:hypothetical protein